MNSWRGTTLDLLTEQLAGIATSWSTPSITDFAVQAGSESVDPEAAALNHFLDQFNIQQ